MTLMTMQEQQEQAQHGLQLTREEFEAQVQAIDQAWEQLTQDEEE